MKATDDGMTPHQTHVARIAALDGRAALDVIPALARMGCHRIELPFGSPGYFDDTSAPQVAQMKKLLTECDVRAQSVHLSFAEGMDIGEPDAQVRRSVVLRQKEALAVAGDLGASAAVQHPSLHWGQNDRAHRIDIAADTIAELAQCAAGHGVKLAVENMLGTIIGCHEDELLQVISRADASACGVCFDTGHANLHGRLVELARALLTRAVTTHLHDNNGSEDQHLFPGMGAIDWQALSRVFAETQCGAMLMVESNNVISPSWRTSEVAALNLLGLG